MASEASAPCELLTSPTDLCQFDLEFSRNVNDRTEYGEEPFTEEQITGTFKQHEAGVETAELCREHGISAATFYAWKSKYGGMDVAEAQRLKGWKMRTAV